MTKIEALQNAVAMWTYIVQHPGQGKQDAGAALNLPALEWPYWCACCAYASERNASIKNATMCRDCPAWPDRLDGDDQEGEYNFHCTAKGHPYLAWEDNEGYDDPDDAAEAHKAAEEILAQLTDALKRELNLPAPSPEPEYPETHAILACRALVAAYHRGEERGGSIDWSDIDLAYSHARKAVGEA
jgi:hypothetical protein